jgi:hypothetical protein
VVKNHQLESFLLSILKMDIPDLLRQLEGSDCPIKSREMLLAALQDLDRMVGMTALKRAVVDQLLFFLANIRSKGIAHATDGHVLHTLLYGPPGVGKTVVGSILARIWASLGILGQTPAEAAAPESLEARFLRDNVNLLVMQKMSSERMERSATAAEATRLKIREMRAKIFALRTRARRRTGATDAAEMSHLDSEIQKLARISSDAFNYCAMILQSLEERPPAILAPPAAPNTAIVIRPAPGGSAVSTAGGCCSPPSAGVNKVPCGANEPLFRVVSRPEFVAEYLGQSAPKTKKLLVEHRGKVLMVDEAYSLYQGDRDSFGSEALTVINQYMTENADSTVLIFAGYKDMMQSSIFKAQPGLQRRFAFTFEITGYSPEELTRIFLQQLRADDWQCPDLGELEAFFREHHAAFPAFGGDTKRLIFQYKMVHSSKYWAEPNIPRTVTVALLQEAFQRYRVHQPLDLARLKVLESQRVFEEESLQERIKEFQERKVHQILYDRARVAEREDLERKLKRKKQEEDYDSREAPTGMYT